MNFQAAYIPVGVGTFHMESADKAMQESIDTLKAIDPEVAVPEEKLLTLDLLRKYLAGLSPDLLVFQNLTFANSAYMSEVMHAFPDVPLVIWTLREPVIDGGRLRLNSLTGAYSAANLVRAFTDRKFVYIYGAATEEKVKTTLAHAVSAARLRKEMQSLTISAVGHTPEGFGFGRALDQDLLKTFGVRLSSIEARELIHTAESYSEEEIRPYLEKACKANQKCFDELIEFEEWKVNEPELDFKQHCFIYQDNNDGKLLIDISGKNIKYAFLDSETDTKHIMSARQYMTWDCENWRHSKYIGAAGIRTCKDNIQSINSMARLMTEQEVIDFLQTDDYFGKSQSE